MLEYFPYHPAVVHPGQIKFLSPTTPFDTTFGFFPIVLYVYCKPVAFTIQFYPSNAITFNRG